jgi:2,3,4,5-tetrahydropyridine-2-carboxylate N-succinyltransferase
MSNSALLYPNLSATIKAIKSIYHVPPQSYTVGGHMNLAGENEGSLAILSFASLHALTASQVFAMFGEAYDEVRADPDGTNHPNIRAFLKYGMDGVGFDKGGIQLNHSLQIIEDAWEDRAALSPANAPQELRDAVELVIKSLDNGTIRSAMKLGNFWHANQAVKKGILLLFRLFDNKIMGESGVVGLEDGPIYFDKVQLKFKRWKDANFRNADIRVVPGAIVRRGSFIGKNVVLMPSFVNIGAYVGEGTMVDAWATVGSCAQIGKNVHLSGGVGIGGVLEPLQANPTIIEDNCFIGARSEIVEGVIIGEGSVISMGVFIGQSTPIVDRTSGGVSFGRIPPFSVVISGTMPMNSQFYGLQKYCAIIVKTVNAQTRAKTSLNELLRD